MSDEAVLFPHGNLQFDSLPPTRVLASGKFEATDCSASQPVGVPAVVTGIFNRLARVGGMLALDWLPGRLGRMRDATVEAVPAAR